MIATTNGGFTILIFNVNTVVISSAVNTDLETSVAGGGSTTTVGIIQALDALVLSVRASTEARKVAVSISITVGVRSGVSWEYTHEVLGTLSVC